MKHAGGILTVALLCLMPTAAHGACAIQGTAVDVSTLRPLPNARIFAEPRSEEAGIPIRHLTNNKGEFCFESLDPGQYVVTAQHSGYLDANYGEKHVGGSPLLLAINADKSWPNLVIKMTAQAVISGRVTDADGDGIAHARVQLSKRGWSDGKMGENGFSDAHTDDEGNFRLAALPPGTYYVSAQRESGRPQIVRELLDENAHPFREREAQTYYNGALSFRAATPIVLKLGQEISGVNVVLQKTALRELSGRLAPGWNAAAPSMLWLASNDGGFTTIATIQKDGTFRADGILPGQYVLQSLGLADSDVMAQTPVDLTEHDADGLILEPLELMTFKAVIRADGASAEGKRPPIDQMILFETKSGDGSPGQREPDGKFSFSGLIPGIYTIGLDTDTYFIKRVLVDGEPANGFSPDNGSKIDLRRAHPKQLELVVSSNMSMLTGKVVADHPITTGVSVLLQEDGQAVTKYDFAGANGQFAWKSLPPGKYHLYAFEDFDQNSWGSPDVAAMLAGKAVPVELHEGEKREVNVPLISAKEFDQALRKAGF